MILRFALRHLVQTWWFELFLPRIGLAGLSARRRPVRLRRTAERFHDLAVRLGGLMIKVGQFLSSRLDVLPPEITRELEGLQDEVPPVPFDEVRALAEAELGMPLDAAFSSFASAPLASASLGQAHRARLRDEDAAVMGVREVVVKVQRPGIGGIVDVDLAALRRIAGWLSRIRIVSRRVDMPALVEEFAAICRAEIDYLHEAANAERFAATVGEGDRGGASVRVPDVVWERTTRRVLTLTDVSAVKITDTDALRAAGIDPAEVASRFAAVMFAQLFGDGFFHADPHPGNLFVTPCAQGGTGNADDLGSSADGATPAGAGSATDAGWQLTFVDFGMMGEISDSLRSGLRELVIAVAARDSARLIDSIRGIGMILPSADTGELERAMTQLFARFGGMSIADLRRVDERELRDFAAEFAEVVREMPFQLPEDLLLVFRAMSLTSGLCSSLDPEFNIWESVEPFAARLLREERGSLGQTVARETLTFAGGVARLPRRLHDLADRLEDGRLPAGIGRLDRRVARLEQAARRVVWAIVFAGLLIAGALLHDDEAVVGTLLMVASALPLGIAVLTRPHR
ncbi:MULTISPECIES: ABC1 kinase family protein [Brevibacterium]|uniref:ABC1 kinase family protein n=1 Tax=Brevibacterium TaxID=1696 RepID=UPI001FE984EE|nr:MULTISPECIES: AarF/UbiB family protein [Brevibacterium]